jgi:hypothetical protein
MSLAWKVMLPLGLVNLATIATLLEFRAPLGLTIAVSWGVMIISWVIAGLLSPLSTDNRPRMEFSMWDVESELN